MPIAPGRRLGPYEILNAIGAGGMGEVYRARDTRLDREVALKVLPPQYASDAERRRRFEQETRVVASLDHPNILAPHDVGTEDGVSYAICPGTRSAAARRDRWPRACPPVWP
jgi:eukaryotic-like serine/threonine-protein kinase